MLMVKTDFHKILKRNLELTLRRDNSESVLADNLRARLSIKKDSSFPELRMSLPTCETYQNLTKTRSIQNLTDKRISQNKNTASQRFKLRSFVSQK